MQLCAVLRLFAASPEMPKKKHQGKVTEREGSEMATRTETLSEHVRDFHWGPVANTYEVGAYAIIEFHPQIFDGCSGTGKYDMKHTQFHVYVDGRDTCRSYHSLDAALAGGIAYRAEGCNHRADRYFIMAMEACAEQK